jgi:hypothetical protein
MKPLRIFISSVQNEFSTEPAVLRDYLCDDTIMRRFFEPLLFEDVPAADRRADELYLAEVEQCDIYLGLFGNEYGYEDADGLSATEREFDAATLHHKTRLIFVKGGEAETRHPKIQKLIQRAGSELIRRRFVTSAELLVGVYAALVQTLEDLELTRTGPFDAAVCPDASLADLDAEAMIRFIRRARLLRGFPLQEDASAFELVVGTRAESAEVPVTYEIPPEVVREAIVNAVAHRDYTSTGSVQVMLFADRLEVWNPGTLSPSLTLEKLRKPHGSFPANPLMAESLYLAKYIERMGTGTGDMITFCGNAGLREPEFSLTDGFVVTIWRKESALSGTAKENISLPIGEVSGEVRRLLSVFDGEMKRSEMQQLLGLRHEDSFRAIYLVPSLKAGLVEMTIPDKPNSRFQKYRLTKKGMTLLVRKKK